MNKVELTLFSVIRNNCPLMSKYIDGKITEKELKEEVEKHLEEIMGRESENNNESKRNV